MFPKELCVIILEYEGSPSKKKDLQTLMRVNKIVRDDLTQKLQEDTRAYNMICEFFKGVGEFTISGTHNIDDTKKEIMINRFKRKTLASDILSVGNRCKVLLFHLHASKF